jgi:tRNA-guanine family transglycosylase
MLISVTSVSQAWTLRDAAELPQHLILDSGGYRYARYPEQRPTARALFERQLKIVGDTQVPTFLCSLDFPILDNDLTQAEKDTCVNQTIAYAHEFRSLLSDSAYPTNVKALGVVQGYDPPSLRHCAHELKSIGFQHFGLGSLAPLMYHEEIMRRVEAVVDVVGRNLHIFGIGAIQTLDALSALDVRSVDTSRPAKAAMYNQVFDSRPFRYYAIAASRDESGLSLSDDRRLRESRPCDCPACQGDVNPDIIKLGKREYVFARTLHNYWHLKRVIE